MLVYCHWQRSMLFKDFCHFYMYDVHVLLQDNSQNTNGFGGLSFWLPLVVTVFQALLVLVALMFWGLLYCYMVTQATGSLMALMANLLSVFLLLPPTSSTWFPLQWILMAQPICLCAGVVLIFFLWGASGNTKREFIYKLTILIRPLSISFTLKVKPHTQWRERHMGMGRRSLLRRTCGSGTGSSHGRLRTLLVTTPS